MVSSRYNEISRGFRRIPGRFRVFTGFQLSFQRDFRAVPRSKGISVSQQISGELQGGFSGVVGAF